MFSVEGFGVRTLPGSVGATWTFNDDKVTVRINDSTTQFQFKLDPSKNPKQIDITLKMDNGEIITSQGVYELSSDMLTFCLLRPGMGRPNLLRSKGYNGGKLSQLIRLN